MCIMEPILKYLRNTRSVEKTLSTLIGFFYFKTLVMASPDSPCRQARILASAKGR